MKTLLFVALLGVLAGCTSSEPRRSSDPLQPELPAQLLASDPPQDLVALPKVTPPSPMALSVGDLLHISVFRQKDLELEARVPESGEISYPLIGEVKCQGRTSKEVENEIKRRLEEKYLHRAGITVTVLQYGPRMVYVLGGVQKPGHYDFAPNGRMTVLQLISTAGGYSDRAFKECAQLIRRQPNGQRETVKFSMLDVEKAVAQGRLEADLEVGPDDLLLISSMARMVYVLGQVNNPKNIDMPSDSPLTVSMAVSQAGSFTKYAAIGRIQVMRRLPGTGAQRFTVDLNGIVDGGTEKDLLLLPGDVIWVPQRSLF